MLEIRCDRCRQPLNEPGALIFSPPKNETWLVEKYHLCARCWPVVAAFLKDQTENPIKRG